MAHLLIFETHASALRLLSECSGMHFSGLEAAGRHYRRKMPGAFWKKLQRLDHAFALVRHITAPGARDFLEAIQQAITAGGEPDRRYLGDPTVSSDFEPGVYNVSGDVEPDRLESGSREIEAMHADLVAIGAPTGLSGRCPAGRQVSCSPPPTATK